MFDRKRRDTKVETIERSCGIDLHPRGDMLLGNLLEERGFGFLTQLVAAYRMRATSHARKRRAFASFPGRALESLRALGAPGAGWDLSEMSAAIESAAARCGRPD